MIRGVLFNLSEIAVDECLRLFVCAFDASVDGSSLCIVVVAGKEFLHYCCVRRTRETLSPVPYVQILSELL